MYDDGLESGKSLAVYVSDWHIDHGQPCSEKLCALSMAASEALPEDWRINTHDKHVEFRHRNGLGNFCVRLGEPEQNFILEFDHWAEHTEKYRSDHNIQRPRPRMLEIPLPEHVAE